MTVLTFFQRFLFILLLAVLCTSPINGAAQTIPKDIPVFDDSSFIYTPDEMLSFDIQQYLKDNAPVLTPYAEAIAHWSAYSTISPKILIALIEYQTRIISKSLAGGAVNIERPFGPLSNKHGFKEQLIDVTENLSREYYKQDKISRQDKAASLLNTGRMALLNALKDLSTLSADQQADKFTSIYSQLFSKEIKKQQDRQSNNTKELENAPGVRNAVAGANMQLPFPVGESWAGGGAHGNDGTDSIFSALDFWNINVDWGGNTSNFWVAAATGGKAVRHSSCSVSVIGPGDWATFYYHLDNVQVSTNQTVSRNQKLANYANNHAQATCQGGSSTGPHIHFSVTKDGKSYDLDGFKLSTFTIHTGRFNYDGDCNYSWYERPDGTKVCPYYRELLNEGVANSTPSILPQLYLLLLKH